MQHRRTLQEQSSDPVVRKKELMQVIGINKHPTVHLTMPIKEIMDGLHGILTMKQ